MSLRNWARTREITTCQIRKICSSSCLKILRILNEISTNFVEILNEILEKEIYASLMKQNYLHTEVNLPIRIEIEIDLLKIFRNTVPGKKFASFKYLQTPK